MVRIDVSGLCCTDRCQDAALRLGRIIIIKVWIKDKITIMAYCIG